MVNLLSNIEYYDNFIEKDESLFLKLINAPNWDKRMKSRYTMSYGVPYNYSEISYNFSEFPTFLNAIIKKAKLLTGFRPNNCLINYYHNSISKMGYHSDNIDILEPNTSILIISLGNTRELAFRKTLSKEHVKTFILKSGSIFIMNQKIQKYYEHAVLNSKTNNYERISITLRRIKKV